MALNSKIVKDNPALHHITIQCSRETGEIRVFGRAEKAERKNVGGFYF